MRQNHQQLANPATTQNNINNSGGGGGGCVVGGSGNEENAKRVVRKAAKLQQRQLVQLLAPFLAVVDDNELSKSKSNGVHIVRPAAGKSPASPLLRSASGSGTTTMNNGEAGNKNEGGGEGLVQKIRLCTNNGESLRLECQWGTRLNQDDTDWVFQLFRRNMRQMYLKSQWGYDECMKLQELQATTARFIILRNTHSKPVAYAHFRFVEDDGRAVLYCFEIQVEKEYQQKGIGTLLIGLLEQMGKSTQMESLMCTVFAFNAPSLAFFHKQGFRSDRTCMFGKDCPSDQCQGRDFVILYKHLWLPMTNEEENGAVEEEGKKENATEEKNGRKEAEEEGTKEEKEEENGSSSSGKKK